MERRQQRGSRGGQWSEDDDHEAIRGSNPEDKMSVLKKSTGKTKMLVTEERKLQNGKGFQTSNYWKEDNNVEVVVRKMTTTR